MGTAHHQTTRFPSINDRMDRKSWQLLKSKYELGEFVQGKVEFHAHFGVFVDIGESLVKGLIKIPDFLDSVQMSE